MADFANLLKQSGATLRAMQGASLDWLRKQSMGITSTTADELIDTKEPFKRIVKLSETSIGKMYMFRYDAKWKHKLPYWDMYPIIFPIEYYGDGFLGINFHYLPPMARAKLMDALMETMNNDRFNKTTKLQISYQILKGASKYSYFRPCVKKYLFSQVRSNFLYISPLEWNIALMLPVQKFVTSNPGQPDREVSTIRVYKDSMLKV